jgi:hypothetical protein
MQYLTIDNYKEIIKSMAPEDWKPLLDLIPVIEETETFTESQAVSYTDDNILLYRTPKEAPVIYTFLEVVYQIPIIIDFDWGSWDEGREFAGNPDTDFDSIDIPTKCKLITAFVRNDRFCDGALASRFEDGTILRILKSISRQLNSSYENSP